MGPDETFSNTTSTEDASLNSPSSDESSSEGHSPEASLTQPENIPQKPLEGEPAESGPPTEEPVAAQESVSPEAEEERKRIQVRPTQSGSAKAVPTYGSDVEMESEMVRTSSSAPVEVPRGETLAADLEASIDAALAGKSSEGALPTTPADIAEEIVPPAQFPTEDTLEPGTHLKARVQSVHQENVFLDLGYRSPGVAQLRSFGSKKPEEGQVIDVLFDKFSAEEGLIYVNVRGGSSKVSGDWSSVSVGQTVDCMVTKVNKGGLEVSVGSLRGFLPASQVDLRYVDNLEPFIGQKLRVQITEVNPRKKNLVVSRKAYMQQERQEAEEMLWTKLDEGQVYTGVVRTLKDYGAFIDIGGVDAFLHIGEMSWNRIDNPREMLKEGEEVTVKIIGLDREKHKISLGLKQLQKNPWHEVETKYATGTVVSGKVTKLTEFGAFVELEPSIEALVHISELAHRRVHRVSEVLTVGQTAEFKVLEVNNKRKRISLSLKALEAKPEEPQSNKKKPEDQYPTATEPYTPKHGGKLKGGSSRGTTGGLFGNPEDFK